jgi:hypothetical protein
VRRLSAPLATAAALLGAVGMLTASGGTTLFQYVSEAGVAGAPRAGLYRASVLLIALSLVLLAAATRVRWAAPTLLLAAPLAAVSGVVTCSQGCPLPPYERSTAADLVHAAASITALLLCCLAMLLYARSAPGSALRTAGRVGLAVAVPLLGLAGAAMVFVGRGTLAGVLERIALVAATAWLIATAALHTRA